MSIEAVISRVSQLQSMLAAGAPPAPSSTSPTSFSTALQSATSSGSGANSFASLASGTPSMTYTATASATSTSSSLPAGTPYAAEITAAATANGIDPALLAGLVKQESGFNPNAGSGAGARGLTQLMPSTAAGLGVDNVLDPVQSLDGGAKYLKQQLDTFGGDVTKALAAYNAGPGAVQRFGGVPPYSETQNYVRSVQANAEAYRVGNTSTPSFTASSAGALPSEI
jgi:soluble lytic murein transglycosylase-like protein